MSTVDIDSQNNFFSLGPEDPVSSAGLGSQLTP